MSSSEFNTNTEKRYKGLKLGIGLPAFNEEKNIASLIIKLKEVTDTIIVCDDGSTDLTSTIAKELGAIVVKHEKNIGYGASIRTIFLKAKELDVDALITFDADGQHRVEDIPVILEPIVKDVADVVIGSRFLDENDAIPKYRKFGIKTITGFTNTTTGSKITDAQSGFRAYNKKSILDIHPSDIGMGVSTEILIKASRQKLRIVEVPITILYHGDTSTHHPVTHGASVILSTMKFVSIERPLTFYGIPGVILLGIGLFFVLWAIQIFSIEHQVITNIALTGIGGVVIGTLLLITAIILYSVVSVVRERSN